MFKKALQIVVTFGLLVGGYETYLLGFAILTDRISATPSVPADWKPIESRTTREGRRLAIESFGPDHWASKPGLKICLYDADRGFYMYAGDYIRKEEGKKFEFFPFAIIWLSKGGSARKTATSDRALVELNQKTGLIKANQDPLHVIEAKLEQNVVIRDDKGTLADRADDLVIGPLPYIEYTEKTTPHEIRSVTDIKLVDRDLTVTGYDLLILMRPVAPGESNSSGFDAQTVKIKKNVHIVVNDVGKSGVLPGTAKSATSEGPTPLDLRNDDIMQIDFPPKVKPLPPKFVGPPIPEGPTFATFHRNVVVERGRDKLKDILNCDTLRLTLFPSPKSLSLEPRFGGALMSTGIGVLEPGAASIWPHYGNGGGSGPLTELAIKEANATGFAVWLTSTAQGIRAKCNELIYKKLMPAAEDETYLRGTLTTPIEVVKVDHEAPQPNPGKITSVTSIWATDAKIFDDGKGGSASTVRSRGPGRLETRPSLDLPAEHGATWQTELVMRTIPMPKDPTADPLANPLTKRLITLTGDPKLQDFSKAMKLEAKQWVIVSLKPRAKDKSDDLAKPFADKPVLAAGAEAPAKDPIGSGSYQIEWLQAKENVRLTSPGKTMIARDELNAPFEQVAALMNEPADPEVKQEPVVADNGGNAEIPQVDGPAFGGGKADPKPKAPAVAAKPEKANEPNLIVTAHRIWAKIRQAKGKSEIAEARLRGDVKFHQDAAPNKRRGTDVTGEALDLETLTGGKFKFRLFNTDPSALGDASRLAARDGMKIAPLLPARIDTEDYTIIGPAIYMDQSVDYAWVNGKGRLIQLADRGFLNDKGIQERIKEQNRQRMLAGGGAPPKNDNEKIPFTISWSDQMQFFGRAKDLQGRPAGKIEFRGDVDAVMEDGRIQAEEIDTYTDRPVSLAAPMKPKTVTKTVGRDTRRIDEILPTAINGEDIPRAVTDTPEDKPELAFIDARNSVKNHREGRFVNAINVKRDQETGERIEVQYIKSDRLTYDRRSGEYAVPGKGDAYLYRRSAEGTSNPNALPGAGQNLAGRSRAVPIANTTKGAAAPGIVKKYQPWELTQIRFEEKMQGRFGSGRSDSDNEYRTADFYGAVQVLNAPVSKEMNRYEFDDHPKDFKRITADSLRVVSEPPDPKDKGAAAKTIVTAENNAQATTNTHTVAGDILTFDSSKDLFYAYGLKGRGVTIVNQANPGQPGSVVKGDAAWYNHKTGAAEPVNPNQIQLIDNSGIRPNEEKAAGPGAKKPRNTRPPLRPPPSSSIERRGFGSTR